MSKIIKPIFGIPESDVIEMIFLPQGEVGIFKIGKLYFNHIKFKGELITDPDTINNILK